MTPEKSQAQPSAETLEKARTMLQEMQYRAGIGRGEWGDDWCARRVALALESERASAEQGRERMTEYATSLAERLEDREREVAEITRQRDAARAAHGLCERHGPSPHRVLTGCWGCSREEETAALEEAKAHARNHHLEACETCIANESALIAAEAESSALAEKAREAEKLLRLAISRCICEGLPWCKRCEEALAWLRALPSAPATLEPEKDPSAR